MRPSNEPRFSKSEHEIEDQFLRRIRVSGYFKFTDCTGRRWWPNDWGPAPKSSDEMLPPLSGDTRPVPPPRQYPD